MLDFKLCSWFLPLENELFAWARSYGKDLLFWMANLKPDEGIKIKALFSYER